MKGFGVNEQQANEKIKEAGIELGQKYRDKITGFEGTATYVSFHINGCIQVALEGQVKDSSDKSEGYVFDAQRLQHLDEHGNISAVASKAIAGGPGHSLNRNRN